MSPCTRRCRSPIRCLRPALQLRWAGITDKRLYNHLLDVLRRNAFRARRSGEVRFQPGKFLLELRHLAAQPVAPLRVELRLLQAVE